MAEPEHALRDKLAAVFARQDFYQACKRRDAGGMISILNGNGVTQGQIAARTGLAQSTLSNYKRGKVHAEFASTFESLADGLDMPPPLRQALGLSGDASAGRSRPAGGVAAGVPADRMPIFEVQKDGLPATYNNPDLTKRLVGVWKKTLGDANVEIVDPTMGGEDFAEYSMPDHSIPAVDFHIGAVDPEKIAQYKKEKKELPSLHSSKFAPVPEPTIKLSVVAMSDAILELMQK